MIKFVKRWWPFFLVLFFLSLFYSRYIVLPSSDLGRHLLNGRLILQEHSIFTTNRYAYTHADFPTLNHHWLFGVGAYAIYKTFGFSGLSLVSTTLYLSSIVIICLTILWLSTKKSEALKKFSPMVLSLAILIALPFLVLRTEVRPEAISNLFFSIFMHIAIIATYSNKKAIWWLFPFVLILSALWVNIHIFFVLGAGLLSAAGMVLILKKEFKQALMVAFLLLGFLIGLIINPNGIMAALYPFRILDGYGYRIAENQSLLFFLKYHPSFKYWFFSVASILITLFQFWKIKWWWSKPTRLFFWIIPLPLLIMFWQMNRFGSFYALSLIPFLTLQLTHLKQKWFSADFLKKPMVASSATIVGFLLIFFCLKTGLYLPPPGLGLGILPRSDLLGSIYRTLDITGPIFNNYDIGSYLEFYVYPQEQVFVDNRPEAYPTSFFTEVYIPAQESDESWNKLDEKYKFGSIMFYRLDATDWAQAFLLRRIEDPTWVPVFVDETTILFIRNIEEHQEIIDKYALPKEMFVAK